jgi:head-tail adaptor
MKILVSLVFILSFVNSIHAFQLSNIKAADLDLSEIEITQPTETSADSASKTENKTYTNLYMSIYNNSSWKESTANDYSANIEVRVRKVFENQYDAYSRVDMDSSWDQIRKVFENSYQFSGFGTYLNMNEFGGSYSISGNVRDESGTKFINVTLYKQSDNFSYYVSGSGIYLNINKHSINGNFDTEQYSKKAVTAIVSLALAVQQDTAVKEKKSSKYEENNLKIWLPIRYDSAFNEIEAEDPYAHIKITLRKVFDTDYNVDTRIDHNFEFGRISNFFTDRYEFTSGRTNLTMEEWAGTYTITGNVEHDNSSAGIRLEMRERFPDDGSFYIREEGIRLYVNPYSITGEVNTEIYSKKTFASISALVMALQQKINPEEIK